MSIAGSERENAKKLILSLLEEDKEFRYSVMGLLGFKEILDKILEIEKRIIALEERQQRLEERFAGLGERQQRLEEEFKKLYERQLALEERFAKLEERFADLEERQQKLEERVTKIEERLVEMHKTLITIADRFGILSEISFREAVKGIVEGLFGATAYKWTAYDREGVVYGHPSEVEVDVVVTDKRHLLVEVKSRADPGDVLELTRIAKLYEEREGVKPSLAIIAGFVSPKARKLAEKLGVKIYTYIEPQA